MSTYEAIELEIDSDRATGIIRLDRPDKLNALSGQMSEELTDAMLHCEDLYDEEGLRAVVITGNGEAFSAGHDLVESGGVDEGEDPPSPEGWMNRLEDVDSHVKTAYELNIPTIAAVNGLALAGGGDLAFGCDLTFASEEAEFGHPGLRLSGMPTKVTYPFNMASMKYTREFMYTGKRISPERAREFGMVNRVVPGDELMDTVYAEIDEIRKVPGIVVRLAKHSLNGVMKEAGYGHLERNMEFLDALAHSSHHANEWFRVRNQEGLQAAYDWQNEENKD